MVLYGASKKMSLSDENKFAPKSFKRDDETRVDIRRMNECLSQGLMETTM